MAIRVALAEDQGLVREALRSLLIRLGMDVVIEAEDGATLLRKLEAATVDVIVSDIRMPLLDGVEMVRRLRVAGNRTPVLLLTTFDDSDLMPAAINAGAQAFMLKGASSEDLRNSIEHVHRGANWLAPVATDAIREHLRYGDDRPSNESFTEREVAILRLLAGGYSNKEIARSLDLAEGTVKNYVSEILAKLGTRDRTRAVLKAITLRIV
jgi:DNA-binding NarL/FixJ family response regulator